MLCSSCPHHGFNSTQFVQAFYDGLQTQDRTMLDATSGGAFSSKTPGEAWKLIQTIANNSQQFTFKRDGIVPKVDEASINVNANRLDKLTSLLEKVVVGQQVKTGVCSSINLWTKLAKGFKSWHKCEEKAWSLFHRLSRNMVLPLFKMLVYGRGAYDH